MSSTYVSRINQLDANQLDDEIYRIFSLKTNELSKHITSIKNGQWTPEINATLKTVIWFFSLGTGKSTFGQKLLDLSYMNFSTIKSILFLFCSVTPKYLDDKFLNPNCLLKTEKEKSLKKWIEKIANYMSIINFINLLMFLNQGNQPTISEKVLGILSKNESAHKPRTIGYSYMTRELLWHGLMELFTIGLPMVNFYYLKRCIFQFFVRTKSKQSAKIIPNLTLRTTCPFCKETPILPSYAGCMHIYCYYCMKSQFSAAPSFTCMLCETDLFSNDMKVYSVSISNV